MRSRDRVRPQSVSRSHATIEVVVAVMTASVLFGALAGCRQVPAQTSKRTLSYLTYLTPSTGSFSSDLVHV
jgi:hypothetical protein